MKKKNYIFYNACFDMELLRRQVILLNDNKIDFQIIDIQSRPSARAPLSSYFEAEIHVLESDFEKADKLMKNSFE